MDFNEINSEFRFPPDWDSPIFSWAQPRFESVFILLHPFVRVPKQLQSRVEEYNRWVEAEPEELDCLDSAEHITWREIMQDIAIPSYEVFVDVVQVHAIGMLTLKSATQEQVEALLEYLKREHIISPATHYLPPTLKSKIEESLAKFGKGEPRWSESPYERENLLYATPYECAYSFICGAKATVVQIVEEYGFEGFFADERTLFDWTEGANHPRGDSSGAMAFKFDPESEG